MQIHTPTIPFCQLHKITDGESALDAVNSMTEDQTRYALWAALVLLFGSRYCNASEIVASAFPAKSIMAEALLILSQVAVNKSYPETMARLEDEYKRLKAAESNAN